MGFSSMRQHKNSDMERNGLLEKHMDDESTEEDTPKRRQLCFKDMILFTVLAFLILESTILVASRYIARSPAESGSTSESCSSPPLRREWRSLDSDEKQDFLQSVHCLLQKKSTILEGGSLYDDFVSVHIYAGHGSHRKPQFLPWHRWFIQQFENQLQAECGYRGQLPYWDWTVDWRNFAASAIWNNYDGFRQPGESDKDASKALRTEASCVSGSFENATFLNQEYKLEAHCLTRQFVDWDAEQELEVSNNNVSKALVSPEAMGQLRRSPTYESLRIKLELQMHNFIHHVMKGDFATISSTNDPIFWLHHAQLDRIWWGWQREDPEDRIMAYASSSGVQSSSSIEDKLHFLGMFKSRTVREVMSTNTGLLCYRY